MRLSVNFSWGKIIFAGITFPLLTGQLKNSLANHKVVIFLPLPHPQPLSPWNFQSLIPLLHEKSFFLFERGLNIGHILLQSAQQLQLLIPLTLKLATTQGAYTWLSLEVMVYNCLPNLYNIQYGGKLSRLKTFADRWEQPFHRENFRGMLKPNIGGHGTPKFRGENFCGWLSNHEIREWYIVKRE